MGKYKPQYQRKDEENQRAWKRRQEVAREQEAERRRQLADKGSKK